jgi:hypothetical protein
LFTDSSPSNRRSIDACVGSRGNVFTESLPSSGSICHNILDLLFAITVAFGSYFTVIYLHMENFIAALITLSEAFFRYGKTVKFRKIMLLSLMQN